MEKISFVPFKNFSSLNFKLLNILCFLSLNLPFGALEFTKAKTANNMARGSFSMTKYCYENCLDISDKFYNREMCKYCNNYC